MSEWLRSKTQMTAYAGEDEEQEKHAYSADLYKHYGNQYGGFSENWKLIYLKTQEYHSWA